MLSCMLRHCDMKTICPQVDPGQRPLKGDVGDMILFGRSHSKITSQVQLNCKNLEVNMAEFCSCLTLLFSQLQMNEWMN